MFKELKEFGNKLKEAIQDGLQPFDAGQFNHPVASKTSWAPLVSGGSNFRTHKFVQISREVHFKATFGAMFFGFIFMAIGIGVSGAMIFGGGIEPGSSQIFMALIPLIFSVVGFFLLRSFMMPRVFNKDLGYYYRGYLPSGTTPREGMNLKAYCALSDIAGIQLLSEYCTSSSSNSGRSHYRSYEINLVLQSGERLNVTDHGSRRAADQDAQKLAAFLQVPLWSAI